MPETPHDPDAKPGQRGYMSPGYEKLRPYGKPDGLADRLEEAAEQLGKNKMLPWLGLGLYDDLRCAVLVLRGETSLPENYEHITNPPLEYDL